MKYWYRFYYGIWEYFGYEFCEHCTKPSKDIDDYNYCQPCSEHLICECGQSLEDSYGQPGDGFCMRCR